MNGKIWRWILGLIYILAVATIWIAASFIVQSVVDAGVSPFLITYICNSLFVIYIPIVEIGRCLEDYYGGLNLMFWRKKKKTTSQESGDSEKTVLLGQGDFGAASDEILDLSVVGDVSHQDIVWVSDHIIPSIDNRSFDPTESGGDCNKGLDSKGRWTRIRIAKVSFLICPFWFFAQLTFNLSLKYTSVTSNTILSSASSLFTFLVSLAFLDEKFTWLKLISVLFCMAGTIVVSLGDSSSVLSSTAKNPFLGDVLAVVSAALYAVYITLIRKKLGDDDDGKNGCTSMAQFLGYVGLFNFLIFLPVVLVLHFTKLEPLDMLTSQQLGLVVGKGLLDNVLSDYLWAYAVLWTTATVATAGLTIQIPLAAIVDTLIGNAPHLMDYIGAIAIMIGFVGINIPSDIPSEREKSTLELEHESDITLAH